MSCTIVTLAELKAELGIADYKDDAALQRLLDGLQGRFEDLTNRLFARAEGTVEYFDGGQRCIYPKRAPVESVSQIVIDGAREFDADDALDADEYWLDPTGTRILPWGTGPWPAGAGNIKVTFTGGYVAAGTAAAAGQFPMPEGLRRAVFMQAAFEFRNRTHLGAASMSAQGLNVQLAPAKLLPEVEEALGPFMRF